MSKKEVVNQNPQENQRLIPTTCKFLMAMGVIGFSTLRFSQKYIVLKNKKKLINHLKKAISLNDQQQLQRHPQHLVYASGQLESNSKQPFYDALFGLTSWNKDGLGLYRKIEIYHPSLKEQVDTWSNINYTDPMYKDENYGNLKSKVIMNDILKLNSYPISNGLAVELAENNSQILKINEKNIEDHFESLKHKFESLQKQKTTKINDVKDQENYNSLQVEGMYKLHPFKFSKEKKKQIFFEDNHIYICENKENFTQGDIRISFYEFLKIKEATLLALDKDGQFDIHKIPDLNYDVKVYTDNGEFTVIKLGLTNFIQKGIIPQQEFIQQCVQRYGKGTNFEVILYTLLISAAYGLFYLDYCSQEEENMININEMQLKIKTKLDIPVLSFFLVFPFWHLGCNLLFLSGRTISFLALGSMLLITQLSIFSDVYQSDAKYYENLRKIKEEKK